MRWETRGILLTAMLAVLVVFIFGACRGPDQGSAEVDVVLEKVVSEIGEGEELYVSAHRWVAGRDCLSQRWPDARSCIDISDMVFTCDPGDGCVRGMRLERGGMVLAMTDPERFDGSWYLGSGVIQTASELELVIESCHGTARIRLPETGAPLPEISELTLEGSEVVAHWTPVPEAAVSVVSLGWGLSGTKCLRGVSGEAGVPTNGSSGQLMSFGLGLFSGGEERKNDLGVFRVWRGSGRYLRPYLPGQNPDGRWSLPEFRGGPSEMPIQASVGGRKSTLALSFAPSLSLEGGTHLLAFESKWSSLPYALATLDYQAGSTRDSLVLQYPDEGKVYRGSFAHVTPAVDLTLGVPEPQSLHLTVGPVTLQDESEPAAAKDVSFSIDWELRVPVARPVH